MGKEYAFLGPVVEPSSARRPLINNRPKVKSHLRRFFSWLNSSADFNVERRQACAYYPIDQKVKKGLMEMEMEMGMTEKPPALLTLI